MLGRLLRRYAIRIFGLESVDSAVAAESVRLAIAEETR